MCFSTWVFAKLPFFFSVCFMWLFLWTKRSKNFSVGHETIIFGASTTKSVFFVPKYWSWMGTSYTMVEEKECKGFIWNDQDIYLTLVLYWFKSTNIFVLCPRRMMIHIFHLYLHCYLKFVELFYCSVMSQLYWGICWFNWRNDASCFKRSKSL